MRGVNPKLRARALGLSDEYEALTSLRTKRGLAGLIISDSMPVPEGKLIVQILMLPERLAHALGVTSDQRPEQTADAVLGTVQRYLSTLPPLDALIGAITWNVSLLDPIELPSGELWLAPDDANWMRRCLDGSLDCRVPWNDERTIRDQSDRLCFNFLIHLLNGPSSIETHRLMSLDQLTARSLERQRLYADGTSDVEDLGAYLSASDSLAAESLHAAGSVSRAQLDDALDATSALARAYYTQPAHEVFLTTHRLQAWALATRGRCQDPGLTRDLDFILSRTHGLTACTALDLGRPSTALRHARASELRADYAQSQEMIGWAFGTQSLILRFQGHDQESLDAAHAGLRLNLRTPTAARLHAQASVSSAQAGSTQDVLDHIAESESLLGAARPIHMTDGVLTFSAAMHRYYKGIALLNLGPDHAAESRGASEEAISVFQTQTDLRSQSDEGLAHLHVAQALAAGGQYDDILEALSPVLHPTQGHTTSWQVTKLNDLVRGLKAGPVQAAGVVAELESSVDEYQENMRATQALALPA